jgi:hypothetical protein
MPLKMEYNTEREIMAIPEYGRHIHKLIDFCKSEPDRNERNRIAKGIIAVMGNMQPHLRDVADFKHKLWDQLFIMADFNLDVDSPYPHPTEESVKGKRKKLEYPKHASKYRYYGNNIENMIETAISWEEGELKEKLVIAVANHMKKCYLLWNKDTVSDDIIKAHLEELSDNKLTFNPDENPLIESKFLGKIQDNLNKSKGKKRKR